MIKVTVAELGGNCMEVHVEENSTVGEALKKFGFDIASQKSITVNHEPAELEDLVEQGDFISVTPRIKGN